MKNYELAKIDYSNGLSIREIADKYNVSVATVRKWKSRYKWDSVTKERDKNMTRKNKEIARVMIEEGATIRETADKVGLPRSTVGDISSKENLQQSQLEYLKKFREEQRERIRVNKLKRLSLNEDALYSIEEEIRTGKVVKATFEKLKLSEEIEQLVFELDRIEKQERLELEKAKLNSDNKQKDKTANFLDKLEEFL